MHVSARLRRWLGLGMGAAALTGTGVLTGPAQAADAPLDTYLTGHGVYSMVATVPGVPGNAHAGFVYFDQGDTVALMYDWRCPDGVTPPDDYYDGAPATSCTLLRSREFYYTPSPTVHGLLRTTFSGPLHLLTYETGQVKDAAPFFVSFRRTGPVTTTVDDRGSEHEVVSTAPMAFSGRLDWLRLSDPRVSTRVLYYQRVTDYAKQG